MLLGVAQRRQRVGGLARLRNEDGEIALFERRLAIAEFRRDIDFHRQFGEALEPVFRHQPGVKSGAAGRQRQAFELLPIERQLARQHNLFDGHVDVAGERVADHFRLLVDFLRHEMLEIAFIHHLRRGRGFDHRPFDFAALLIVDLDALVRHHRPVAVLQIADGVGERGKRDGIGAEIHLAVAIADGERRTLARADHQVVLAGEQEGEREGAAQLLERGGHRLDRRFALFHLLGHQMGDHLGVGLAGELGAVFDQPFAQLAKILDDAVMGDRDAVGGVRMGVALGRLAVGGPAGMADADIAGERLARQARFQRGELALGAPASQGAVIQGGDPGGVVAAVFEALERLDQMAGDRLTSNNSDDPAHPFGWPLFLSSWFNRHRQTYGNQNAFRHITITERQRADAAVGLISWAFSPSSCPSP